MWHILMLAEKGGKCRGAAPLLLVADRPLRIFRRQAGRLVVLLEVVVQRHSLGQVAVLSQQLLPLRH